MNGEVYQYDAPLQCFCKVSKKFKVKVSDERTEYTKDEKGWNNVAKTGEIANGDKLRYKQKFAIKYTDAAGALQEPEVEICRDYFSDALWSKALGSSVALVIVVVNLILKSVIILLVNWVGQDTWSKQLSSITNGVFVAQFFNTGILLLLVNANLSEHTSIPFYSYANGPFYDYSPQWYVDVGFKLI